MSRSGGRSGWNRIASKSSAIRFPTATFARPVAARHGLIDHRNPRRLSIVLLGQSSSLHEADSHQPEVIPTDTPVVRLLLVPPRRHGTPIDVKPGAAVDPGHGQIFNRRHAGHPGLGRNVHERRLVEFRHTCRIRVGCFRQRQVCREDAGRGESGVNLFETDEAADRQPRRYEQHEGERHLANHEHGAETLLRSAGARACGGPQCPVDLRSRRRPRRNQSEYHRRSKRHGQSKDQHGGVDVNRPASNGEWDEQAVSPVRDRDEQVDQPHREQQSARATGRPDTALSAI